MTKPHPNEVLSRQGRKRFPVLAVCEHYAGSKKPISKALALHTETGPIQHAGKLHDRASFRYYWELLQRANATGVDLPESARHRFFNA